jgi:hypothetical protein
MPREARLPDTFPGVRYCKTMQASVDAILFPMGISRRVVSFGRRFLNVDAWTGQKFVDSLCAFWSKTPRHMPSAAQVQAMVAEANGFRCANPHILVAAMPTRVSHRVVLAIIGGGYHEAWHTKYSKRDAIKLHEIKDALSVAAGLVHEGGAWDAKTRGLLVTLSKIIEDIRIERRGNEDFPGALQPMRDLQDFILGQEAKARSGDREDDEDTSNDRSILLCCFRDLGLGYNTETARATLQWYRESAPSVVSMLADGGLLAPMLVEAKNLAAEDKMGALRVAAKIVVALWRASQAKDRPNPECPSCGADASQIEIGAAMDAEGKKIRGRGELRCRACGYRHEFDLPDVSLNLNQQDQKDAVQPEITDDLNPEDVGAGQDGFGDDVREAVRDSQNSPQDVETPPPLPVVPVVPPSRAIDEGEDPEVRSGEEMSEGADEESAIGPSFDLGWEPTSQLAEQILSGSGEPLNSSSIADVLAQEIDREHEDLQRGELPWCPLNPSLDEAAFVQPATTDEEVANQLLSEVQEEVVYLRARLRTIVLAQEMVDTSHGFRKGRRLSSRMLVDSHVEILANSSPSRAYVNAEARTDTSLALAVCLDESGSMRGQQRVVAQCMLLLCDAVESVQGKTMAFGFRDACQRADVQPEDGREYHRTTGVRYDVFKVWEETLSATKRRFACTKADGNTPMADGVQYGLMSLNDRREAHRILAVVTDGEPDHSHERVIQRQCRLAREAGVHVLGIGIGHEARYVKHMFPDHVHVDRLNDLPEQLVAKMNDLCDFTGRFRGSRVHLDGAITRHLS